MSRVIQCELILPITAKFIRVCTMYVQCMYTVYHGSWRDFTTAVGGFSIRVLFASLTRHTLRLWALTRPSAQPTVPCQGKGECFVFATNGTIERFGDLARQELMNVWRDSILFASLTRHTIVANATIKTVPCHGKSGCLRLRSN